MAAKVLSDHAFNLGILIKEASPGTINKFKAEFQKLSGAVEMVSKATKNFGKVAAEITSTALVALASAIVAAAKEMIFLDDKIARMGMQFGLNNKQIKEFNYQLYTASIRSGIIVDQLFGVANALREADYKGSTKDLVELSETVYKFSEVSGVSIAETAEFSGELEKLGIKSGNLLKGLASLRTSMSLSSREFKTVIEVTKFATEAMYGYGNALKKVSQTDMDEFGKSAGRLAGMMMNMGLSAEATTKIIKGMVDPIEWLNNPTLMVMLGVNFQDAMDAASGLSGPLEQNVELMMKMKDKMQQLQQGGTLSFAMIAKSMGLTLQQVTAISNWTEEAAIQSKLKAEEDKKLNDLWENMGEAVTHFQRVSQRAFATFIVALKPAINMISGLLEGITLVIEKVTTITSGIGDFVAGLGEAGPIISTIFGVTTMALITALGVLIWKMGMNTAKTVGEFFNLDGNIKRVSASSATGTISVEMMAAAIGQLGIKAGITSLEMQKLAATSQLGGVGGVSKVGGALTVGAGAASAIKFAGKGKELQGEFGYMDNLSAGKMTPFVTTQGSKLGSIFGKAFSKALPIAGIIGTVGGAFQAKRFGLSELGSILLSVGMMIGMTPAGWGLMAAGLLCMIATGLVPSLNKDWGLGKLMGGAKASAMNDSTSGIKNKDQFIKDYSYEREVAREAQSERSSEVDERILKTLLKTEGNTSETYKMISLTSDREISANWVTNSTNKMTAENNP
jgi:hypothetical protein